MREAKGYMIPILTPFNKDGSIDEKGMRQNISYLIDEGIHGITLTGSFGEFPILTFEERIQLFEIAMDETAGRCAVIAGTAHAATAEVIKLNDAAERIGMDGVMVTQPYYLLPSERDIINHFSLISKKGSLPITVYNNGARTGINMGVPLLLELVKIDRVVSVKQSSSAMTELIGLIRQTKDIEGFFVTNGQEPRAFPALVMGAEASYGISPMLLGKECIDLYRCAKESDVETGRAIQLKIDAIRSTFAGCGCTPAAALKFLVNKRGLAGGYPRAPIAELSDDDKNRLSAIADKVGVGPV